MAQSPDTRPSLLLRLRDARDDDAWSHFVSLYAPLIYGYARKHGLQDPDAADLTQDVLATVARTMRSLTHDRRRGTFRGWLFTITRNRLLNLQKARPNRPQATGDTATQVWLQEQPAPSADPHAAWNEEYEQQLFAWACEQVRPRVEEHTWRAFWLTAVEGAETKDAAQALGLTPAAVRLAKSRVMAQIRRLIQTEEGE